MRSVDSPGPRRVATQILLHAVPIAIALVMIVPFCYMLIISLQNVTFLPGAPSRWISQPLTLDTYGQVVATTDVGRWLVNSTVVATAVAVVGTIISAAAGFVFYLRREQRSGRILFASILLGMMVPKAVTVIPLFLIVREADLLNSYLALAVPPLGLAVGVFMMRQAMYSFPTELLEAARVDGASDLRIFVRIALPVLMPALAVVAIITFMDQWREFLWPLIVTSRSEMATLPVGVAGLSSEFQTNYGVYMAGVALAIIPGIGAFVVFQRWIIAGITAGAVRG